MSSALLQHVYSQWGFKSSPFQTTSLPASEVGAMLLTGRDKELSVIARRIVGVPKFATVEGLNGVGKTSIVNVAAYKLFEEHMSTGEGPLFIPCRKIFQLHPDQNLQKFVDEVLFEVAQTLIERAEEIKKNGVKIKTKAVDTWLNSPQLSTYQAGIQAVMAGLNLGKQSETNTSKGFDQSGFQRIVKEWLATVFPEPESGGVVCMIDNLELLQSSDKAKELLEQLRDELLTLPGLRWVFCGALGIVYGVVASPRLEGYLHKPVPVAEIEDKYVPDILENRIKAFGADGQNMTLPLLSSDFGELYKVLHGILRSVLSAADDYCNWIDTEKGNPKDDNERHEFFMEWLREQSAEAYQAVQLQLRARALKVFDDAVTIGGVFSPSDFQQFGFNGIQQFRPSIKDLENAGVLVSTRDEGDKRRKTIQITAKGWLISYHLQNTQHSKIEPLPGEDEVVE